MSGAWGAAQGIAGYGPMPPAPHGGPAGRSHDPAATDYGGARPIGAHPSNPYRDPSYDFPGGGSDSGHDSDDDPRDDPTDNERRGVVGTM